MADRGIRGGPFFTGTDVILTTPYTMKNAAVAIINLTTPGAVAVTLPALPTAYAQSANGRFAYVKDGAGNAATYPITITDPASALIDGAANYVIDQNYASVLLLWDGESPTPQWRVLDEYAGEGTAGLGELGATNAITAHAGGGQTNAVPLTTGINRITTVATGGDSVLLPVSAPGTWLYVKNSTATSCNVFPQGTDVINALSASAAFALTATTGHAFFCAVAGQWDTL